MKLRVLLLSAVILLLASMPQAAAQQRSTVLLELFTSEGCSSCPEADRVLAELSDHPYWRRRIVAMAYHVDYWDQLGWADSFSDERWSARQRRYGQAFHRKGVYTPQLVIQGAKEIIGSHRTQALRDILEFSEKSPWVRLGVERSRPSGALGQALVLNLHAELLRNRVRRRLVLAAALCESGLQSPVTGGENQGRLLKHDCVVRELVEATRFPSTADEVDSEVVFLLPEGAPNDSYSVAVFVQDLDSMEVWGSLLYDL
ncbi:MAG: DUF1223 domain-containing protein [Candidatus Omnitrophica bacterium]|nr:DUF1223 domain-containing protein [Candidatus Omnitrophota bacterium]